MDTKKTKQRRPQQIEKKALIVGATGAIGSELAGALKRRGYTVIGLHRDPARARAIFGDESVRWVHGDSLIESDVLRAAEGCSIIAHAVNPPGYKNWELLVLPMLDHTITAAIENQALILFPGSLYNYPTEGPILIDEETPQYTTTKKGAIRIEMEERLKASIGLGTRVLIVRAGDYFGPSASAKNSLFKAMIMGKTIWRFTSPGAAHSWAYLPDVAETFGRLVEREDELAPFAHYMMRGHIDETGEEMPLAIQRALEEHDARSMEHKEMTIRAFPWQLVRAGRFFSPFLRELYEMRYLYERPLTMRNAKLLETLGSEPHTPLRLAVQTTLGLGQKESQSAA